MRPAPPGRGAAQLAVPPRPPHRRLLADSEPGDRLKFRMPAEWERHEATWIAWPHNEEDWPGRFAPIPWVYAEIVRKLAAVERVRILVQDEDAENAAREALRKVGAELAAVDFYPVPTD